MEIVSHITDSYIRQIESLSAKEKMETNPLARHAISRAIQAYIELLRNKKLRNDNLCVFSSVAFTHGIHFIESFNLYEKLANEGDRLDYNMLAKATRQDHQGIFCRPIEVASYLYISNMNSAWVITDNHTMGIIKVNELFAFWNTYNSPEQYITFQTPNELHCNFQELSAQNKPESHWFLYAFR